MVIKGANILDVTNGELKNHVVVVDDGRIKKVSPASSISPKGVEVVDLQVTQSCQA